MWSRARWQAESSAKCRTSPVASKARPPEKLGMELNHRSIKTIPRQDYEEIGDALGIRRNGVLVFGSEDMSSVMMDCCLYDWYGNGKNLIQRYAETHPAVPGAGLHCQDVLNGGELFLM